MELYAVEGATPPGAKSDNPNFSTKERVDSTTLSHRMGFAFIAFLFWIVSTGFIVFFPAVLLLPYLASNGVALSDGAAIAELAKNDVTAILIQLAAIVPAHLATVLIAWLLITQAKKFTFLRTLGMESGGVRWWYYAVTIVAFFVCAALVQSVLPEQEHDMMRILRSSRGAAYLIAFVATFSAPLVEEVVYRGILYSAFTRAFGVPASFVLVTLLFALVHVPQYYPSYATIILLTLLSLTLTAYRVASNNLLPCIILHTIFNGIQSLVLVLEPLARSSQPESAATIIRHIQ